MSTQRQVRGASAVIQAARTLVSRVLDINTTKNRIHVYDGSTVGGIPHILIFILGRLLVGLSAIACK